MEKKFGATNDLRTIEWLERTFQPEDEVLNKVRKNSIEAGLPPIAVGPFDGRLLTVLAQTCGAKKIVEIGTLGGYSGICLLRGAGPHAKLHTFEISNPNAEAARKNFALAGVAGQVEMHVGPAMDLLPGIEKFGPFDLVFIDADKNGYPAYLEWAYNNLRTGGIALGDNSLAWDLIAQEDIQDDRERKQVASLRKFNELCADRKRWTSTLIPTGEGLTIAVKN